MTDYDKEIPPPLETLSNGLPVRSVWRIEVAAILNELSYATGVRWDRTAGPVSGYDVFGWIHRPDGGTDFVVVGFSSHTPTGYTTSSAEWSNAIGSLLFGGPVGDTRNHYPCQRVPDIFPDVKDVVSWQQPAPRRRLWRRATLRSENRRSSADKNHGKRFRRGK